MFFLDWEKTQVLRARELGDMVDANVNMKNAFEGYKSKVSVWRQLLVANEYNEITTYRIVST